MTNFTRRSLLQTSSAVFAAAALPRFAIAQADSRPSITIAVQKVSTSNTLEPMREQSNVGQRTFSLIAESLIDLDWTGNMLPMPRLASAWRRIDGRTVELTLRDNVRFHDGRMMTAEDVAFSFGPERMWAGGTADSRGMFGSTTAGQKDKLPPPEALGIARNAYPAFERIEIVDKNTVRFVNKTPDVTIEGRLTRNVGTIWSRSAFDAAKTWLDWARKPVGTGPYRVAEYQPDSKLVLEAFDDYWSGRPPIRRLTLVEVPEVASRVAGLMAGDFDFATDLPPDQITEVERSARHHVVGGPIVNNRVTIMDKTHPVLANPLVRRAMSHAVDRQAIVEALWLGRTVVSKGLQYPFYGQMFLADWENPAFSPDEAKKLLTQAGYKGEEIPYQLLNNYYTNQMPTAQILVEGWRQVGLNVKIEMKENWSQILGRDPRRCICDNSNSSWFPDPVASIASYTPGGQTYEAGQWRNDEANAAFERLQNSTDMDERRNAYRRVLGILEREDPAYILLHQNATFIGKRRDLAWKPAGSFVMDFRAGNWA